MGQASGPSRAPGKQLFARISDSPRRGVICLSSMEANISLRWLAYAVSQQHCILYRFAGIRHAQERMIAIPPKKPEKLPNRQSFPTG
jgi:hypothetical protein